MQKGRQISFSEAIKSVLGKYADFNGRARRSEYWYWVLAWAIIYVICLALSAVLGDALGLLGLIFTLATSVPYLAVTARRLHDIGRSGWWQLIAFVPLAGFILMLIWTTTDSQPGENDYGPSPKEPATGYGAVPAGSEQF